MYVMRAGYCLVTRPAKYVFCGKTQQLMPFARHPPTSSQYRGQPIHTEAGKRVVNSYAIESAGAKYVFCGKIPQFTGPWEDLTIKFVFQGMGWLSYKCRSAENGSV
jgi:hypothetical protein